jgi:hypothetical protein
MLGYGANRALFGMYGSFGGERLPNGTQITRLFSAMSDLERSATDPAVTADPEHIHFAVAPEIVSTGSRYRRVNPDYTRAIARIVSAVAPYPDAREAVIAALRDLDATSSSARALMDRRSGGAVVDG